MPLAPEGRAGQKPKLQGRDEKEHGCHEPGVDPWWDVLEEDVYSREQGRSGDCRRKEEGGVETNRKRQVGKMPEPLCREGRTWRDHLNGEAASRLLESGRRPPVFALGARHWRFEEEGRDEDDHMDGSSSDRVAKTGGGRKVTGGLTLCGRPPGQSPCGIPQSLEDASRIPQARRSGLLPVG